MQEEEDEEDEEREDASKEEKDAGAVGFEERKDACVAQ